MAFPDLCVRREFSAEALNHVVNHPAVRPWVAAPGTGYLDLSSVVADQRNYLLMGQGGGFLLQRLAPGLYEAHSQFIPEARGPAVAKAAEDASRYMFTRTDCVEIVTKVPKGNVGAAALARMMKWQLQFERANAWLAPSGLVPVSYYSKTIGQWASQTADLERSGQWFHGKLESAKIERGAAMPIHDDDPAHDRYVGATAEMMAAGQVLKAIDFYSRWAVFAGYGPIALIADNPPVLDIGDAILAVRDNDFDVILAR